MTAAPSPSPSTLPRSRDRSGQRPRRLVAALVLASVTLLTLDLQLPDGPTGWLQRAADAVLVPLAAAATSAVGVVGDSWTGLADGRATADRARALEAENAALRAQLRAEVDAGSDAAQVAAVQRLAGGRPVIPARVVAVAAGPGARRAVTIDAGSGSGVRTDATVVAPLGLVGRVVEVTAGAATVQLLTDPTSAVGGRLVSSRQVAAVRGAGTGVLALELLDEVGGRAGAAGAGVRPGEQVVTFGSAGATPYVAGVPVGRVETVIPGSAASSVRGTVVPAVDPGSLDVVGVVLPGPAPTARPLAPAATPQSSTARPAAPPAARPAAPSAAPR